MKKILIKGGQLVSLGDGYDFNELDILIEDGLIVEIDKNLHYDDAEIINAENKIVSPGLIDVHAHVFTYNGIKSNGVSADEIGIKRGTTTIIDAGSSGPSNIDDFVKEVVKKSKTKVYSLLNVSKHGLLMPNELNSLKKIDEKSIYGAIDRHPNIILGLKARASSSVVGKMGIIPITMASSIATKANLPLMIHTGNFPPYIEDVLNLMQKGDILTHAFHGKEGGILKEDLNVIEEAIKARKRGVLFDVGHGAASFSFKTLKNALKAGFYPDMISTDLHKRNVCDLVYSQHAVITKLLNCGVDLAELIKKATSVPADHFNLKGLGHLKVDYVGDISISELVETDEVVHDSMGNELKLEKKFVPYKTVISSKSESEIISNV